LLGHGKRDCLTSTPFEGKNGWQLANKKDDTTTTNKRQQKKTQGTSTLPKCTYVPYSQIGHTKNKCWVNNPTLKPQSFTSQAAQGGGSKFGGNSLEADMGELQNTLALFVATIAKTTPTSSNSKIESNRFEYRAIGKVVAIVATKSHINFMPVAPIVEENIDTQSRPHVCYQRPFDSITQSRLPLPFGLVDVISGPSLRVISNGGDSPKEKDMVKDLALKLLEVPLFSRI